MTNFAKPLISSVVTPASFGNPVSWYHFKAAVLVNLSMSLCLPTSASASLKLLSLAIGIPLSSHLLIFRCSKRRSIKPHIIFLLGSPSSLPSDLLAKRWLPGLRVSEEGNFALALAARPPGCHAGAADVRPSMPPAEPPSKPGASATGVFCSLHSFCNSPIGMYSHRSACFMCSRISSKVASSSMHKPLCCNFAVKTLWLSLCVLSISTMSSSIKAKLPTLCAGMPLATHVSCHVASTNRFMSSPRWTESAACRMSSAADTPSFRHSHCSSLVEVCSHTRICLKRPICASPSRCWSNGRVRFLYSSRSISTPFSEKTLRNLSTSLMIPSTAPRSRNCLNGMP
mmetsp:Transcript_3817/g.9716  ORF Transcript_3817/g.9716 Transcript_3817/m.9716 type:complete len:342 (-) Transcript_3817:851-1876(-)